MCGHAGSVGALRPVRRLPPPAGRPGAGRRPGPAARPARASPPPAVRTAVSRMVRQGWLHPAAAGRRTGLPAHPEGGPPARRGGRPDLPHRPKSAGTAASTCSCSSPAGAPATRQRLGANLAFLGYGTLDERTWVAARPGRGGGRAAERGRRAVTSGSRASHAAGTAGRRRRWSAGPGTWPRSAAAYERFVAEQTPAARRGHRAQRRRGGVRGPVPARARVAYVPVPRPAAAAGAAARRAGPAPARPPSSTGTRPGCGRPPTGTSTAASTRLPRSVKGLMTRDRRAARRPRPTPSSRSR